MAVPGLCYSMWDLAPWPGIEPRPPALEVWSLSHGPPGEVPTSSYLWGKFHLEEFCIWGRCLDDKSSSHLATPWIKSFEMKFWVTLACPTIPNSFCGPLNWFNRRKICSWGPQWKDWEKKKKKSLIFLILLLFTKDRGKTCKSQWKGSLRPLIPRKEARLILHQEMGGDSLQPIILSSQKVIKE